MQAAGPQCPKCGANLKDDYGMVTCESCGSILIVDIDGNVHDETAQPEPQDASAAPTDFAPPSYELPSYEPAEGDTAEAVTESFSESAAEPVFTESVFSSPDWESPPAPSDVSEPLPEMPVEEAPSTAESGFADMGSLANLDPLPDPVAEPPISEMGSDFAPETLPEQGAEAPVSSEQAPEEFNMDALLGYQPEQQNPVDGFAPAGDPLGLNEYANSEFSQAKDGLLVFKVLISGIDSKEIRESIREAMEDSRFGWDVNSIIGQIDKGELAIENLSPVKATILINRIKRLPIRIRWEQYAITQLDEGENY